MKWTSMASRWMMSSNPFVNARKIDKTIRSRSPLRAASHEKLYIIKSTNYEGTLIYTKGTIRQRGAQQVFYILVAAKIAGDEARRSA